MKNALDIEHIMGYNEIELLHMNIRQNILKLIGKLINSSNPEKEIAIIEGGIGAWSSILPCIPLQPRDIILVTKIESGSNYFNILHYARRIEADIMYIPSESNGSISLVALKSMLESLPNVRIVCLPWIPSNGASSVDMYECGKILACYSHIIFIIDANQAVGQQHIDVAQLHCHLLTGTSNHYLRSPHGVEFLYISPHIVSYLSKPTAVNLSSGKFTDLQSNELYPDARQYQVFSTNYNLLIGFEAALEYYFSLIPAQDSAFSSSSESFDEDQSLFVSNWCLTRFDMLGKLLVNSFSELQTLSQDRDSHCRELIIWNSSAVSGILCFTINGISSQRIREILRSRNIFVSICKHPESAYIDAVERRLPDRIRISIHYFNTEIEIFIVCDIIKELLFEE